MMQMDKSASTFLHVAILTHAIAEWIKLRKVQFAQKQDEMAKQVETLTKRVAELEGLNVNLEAKAKGFKAKAMGLELHIKNLEESLAAVEKRMADMEASSNLERSRLEDSFSNGLFSGLHSLELGLQRFFMERFKDGAEGTFLLKFCYRYSLNLSKNFFPPSHHSLMHFEE